MLYGVKSALDLTADLILCSGADTYVCVFDPSKINPASELPYEEQPVWQITLYRESEREDGTKQTQTLYPNGSQAFGFMPSKIDDYAFRYRL